jgi:protein phosphatase
MIPIAAAGVSDIGCKRERNEDRIVVNAEMGVFVLADGMGGERCGALAAELAVQAVEDYALTALPSEPQTPQQRITAAVQFANRTVWLESRNSQGCEGMGSTLSVVFITDSAAAIANIGDSRVYLYRDGQLRRLTRDDAVVANLIDAGQITPQMAKTHPMKNVLTAALGRVEEAPFHVADTEVRPGDRLLLSSDGLHGVMDDSRIEYYLRQQQAPHLLAQQLIEEARELGGPDNISCIVIEALLPSS